ncbi:hypothetical protein CNR22_11540 [Sphingobacteriaceae bacterium]|nr:hypothetical protein CNR22_11540 [Sphingobacteriaceae bacterium]
MTGTSFKKNFSGLLIFFCLYTVSSCLAQNKGDQLIGKWMDSKHQMLVNCYKENGKYFAKVLWVQNLKDPGKPLPKERQHWINMVAMKNFEYKNGEWTNGTIYQPKTDKTYCAFITPVNENTIKVTGYVWLRIFSESEIFVRVKK